MRPCGAVVELIAQLVDRFFQKVNVQKQVKFLSRAREKRRRARRFPVGAQESGPGQLAPETRPWLKP